MVYNSAYRPRPAASWHQATDASPRDPWTWSSGGANMTSREHIRNPVEWTADQLWLASLTVGSLGHSVRGSRDIALPTVRRIRTSDLRAVLMRGLADFEAYRSDVIFICLIYPLVGILPAWRRFGYLLLPLLFPLPSGFPLLGPSAAVGFFEMSRGVERGLTIGGLEAFGWAASPDSGRILCWDWCCWRSSC